MKLQKDLLCWFLVKEKSDHHQIDQQQRSEACEVIQSTTASHNSEQDHKTALMKEESKALREVVALGFTISLIFPKFFVK